MHPLRNLALAALLVSPLAAQDMVSLTSVKVDLSGMVHVTYSKNFATCAHLMTPGRQLVHTQNHFCTSGNDVVISVPLTAFNASFAIGASLILCHGNNYNVCSSQVRVVCTGEYGTGCAGSGGKIPRLSAEDACPPVGSPLAVSVSNGRAAANAVVFFGTGQASFSLLGCTVLILPLPLNVPMTLNASGAGGFSVIVPPGASGGSLTMQAFVVDAGAAQGLAGSNGYQVDIP